MYKRLKNVVVNAKDCLPAMVICTGEGEVRGFEKKTFATIQQDKLLHHLLTAQADVEGTTMKEDEKSICNEA